MGQLEDMSMFVRVVEAGSITKAAEQLNIAKSAVSRRLKDLETRLGNQLISRTTRQSNLTEAGEQYYQRACSILNEVDALNEQTSGAPTRIEGTLKMTAPLTFGLMHLSGVDPAHTAGCRNARSGHTEGFQPWQFWLIRLRDICACIVLPMSVSWVWWPISSSRM